MNKSVPNRRFKKTNTVLIIFLTIITSGIYLGYWFLSRKDSIQSFKEKHHVSFGWWTVAVVFLSVSLFLNLFGWIFLTATGQIVIESVNVILSFYFLGLLYYSVFRIKELIERNYDEFTIKSIWLVLFHVWYLQFKLNRLEGARRG